MNAQNNYCDISEHCKLLCEANKNYHEALQYIGKTELEKEQLRYQISLLRFDNKFYNSVVIRSGHRPANIQKELETKKSSCDIKKLKSEIKKICTENLQYRSTMGGYIPTRPTRVLEKIIEIIDKEN